MYCKHCGKKNPEGSKFCKHCGVKFNVIGKKDEGNNEEGHSEHISSHTLEAKKSSNAGKIITALVVLTFIGFGIYGNVDKESIKTNNKGLTSFDSGDSKSAIDEFRQAANDATSDKTKIATLKNLGYVYSTNSQNNQALSTFKEALALTTKDTFDYYLVSGEVALLEGKTNEALSNYNKAYRINPEDFQINNALALFHMDLEEVAPRYVDYKKALLYAQKAYDLNKLEVPKQNLAIAYYLNEDYSQTISLLSSSNLNQHPYAAYFLGLAYLQTKDDINARIYFQKAIDGGAEIPKEIHDYLNSN